MLTREQVYTMLMLRKHNTIFSMLPGDVIRNISDCGQEPNSEIAIALRFAADGTEKALNDLTAMLKKNPRLLLQAGNVVTRCGLSVRRVTLYEFFLGAGDPDAAKRIEPYFAEIKSEDGKPVNGEGERMRQYERYRPHIEALAKQLELKQPAYDLRPLVDIIKQSTPQDITATLKNDMTHDSVLRDALIQFIQAVRPTEKAVGMHYKHYTTLIQAFDLLYNEWKSLSNNYTNYDKCDLVALIIIYLQSYLPAVDRFGFARAFDDKERTLKFKYVDRGAFPDTSCGGLSLVVPSFDAIIFGRAVRSLGRVDFFVVEACMLVGNFMSSKSFRLAELMQPHQHQTQTAGCMIC